MSENMQWAKDAVEKKSWVLHIPTQTIDQAKKFWDGVVEQWISSVNRTPVQGPVLQTERGHGFVAKEEAFIVLTEDEGKFYAGMVMVITKMLTECVKMGAEMGVSPASLNILIIGAMRTQAMVLEAGHYRAFGGAPADVMG